MTAALIANDIGLVGVIVLLVAYFLLQSEKMGSHDFRYLLLNLVGALMIFYSLLFDWNLPALLMEAAWALVSIFGMIKVWTKRKHNRALKSVKR